MCNVAPGRSNPLMSGSPLDRLLPNTPCSTRFVDGFLRGSLFGLAWGLTVDRVDREICRETAGKAKGTLLNLGVGVVQVNEGDFGNVFLVVIGNICWVLGGRSLALGLEIG